MTAIGYGDAFDIYYRLGWAGVLPLDPGTKYPPPQGFTGRDGIDPSYADMYSWAERRAGDNLALRLSDEEIGIDVDAYGAKTGAATLAEAEKRWGPLLPTYRSTSRDDGVSGIKMFRVPPGTVFRDNIQFRELGIGDIDVIQRRHRYVMSWPSLHPEKRAYRWIAELDGSVCDHPPGPPDLPDLPPVWLENLRVINNGADLGDTTGSPIYDVDAAFTAGEPSPKVSRRLSQAIADLAASNRHDDTRDHVLGLLRYGKDGEPGVKAALIALRTVFIGTVTADGSRTAREASDEFKRMVRNPGAAQLLGEPSWPKAEVRAELGGHSHRPQPGDVRADKHTDFWQASKELKHIQTFAYSRWACPWAVLGAVLARIAAAVPCTVQLPAITGDAASLNHFYALVGESGRGKGVAERAAHAAVRLLPDYPFHVTGIGSGEGLNHLFARYVKPRGKPGYSERHRWAVHLSVPEIETWAKLINRQGATLGPQLRKAWSGESLTFAYADPTKALEVDDQTYRLTAVTGVQPGKAGALLDDADAGTPQRFLWLPVIDPYAPDVKPDAPDRLELVDILMGWPDPKQRGVTPVIMDLPDKVVKLLDDANRARLRGEPLASELDGHLPLCQVKTAAPIALLHGERSVSEEHWQLSQVLMGVSRRTRDQLELHRAHHAAESIRARGEAEGRRAVVASGVIEAAAIARVAGNIRAKLRKARGGEMGWSDLRGSACAGAERGYFESAIDHLVTEGKVEVVDNTATKGRVVRRLANRRGGGR